MFTLALSSLRRRKSSVIGAFLALFCAAAMVCGCGALLETGIHGTVAAQRYAGTPTIVTADQQIHWTKIKHKHGGIKKKTKSKQLAERAWAPAEVGAKLAAVQGATVVPDRTFAAELFSPGTGFVPGVNNRTLGHNWRSATLTPYRLVDGTAPTRDNQIVIDSDLARRAHLSVGSRIGVQSTASPTTYVVSGVADPRHPVTEQSAIFFSEHEAIRLSGHGSAVAAYGVFGADPGDLRNALRGTDARVATGESRGAAEFPDAASARVALTSMGGAIGGTALIVAVFVVVGIFSLSVQQRHRELALLRVVGATPRQVRRLIGREALVIGLLAAVPGAVAGIPLAEVMLQRFIAAGAMPDTVRLTRSVFPVLAAGLVTVVAALAAARISARRIGRISPADALTESALERRGIGAVRLIAGLLVTGGATVITILLTHLHTEPAAMPVTYLSALLWLIAAALLGPLLVRVATTVLGVPWRLSTVSGFLAVENSRLRSRRVAAVVAPLALLIGMTATIVFVPATLASAARTQATEGLRVDHVLRSTGPGVPDRALDELRHARGVTAAVPVVRSTLWVGRDKRSVQGVGSTGLTDVIRPGVVRGSLHSLRTGTIAMSNLAAEGRPIGSTVHVTLGDGVKTSYRLVAVYDRRLGFGDALLPFDTLRRHVDVPLAGAVLIRGSVAADTLDAFPGLQLTGGRSYAQGTDPESGGTAGANSVFLALIIVFSAIAAFNTLAMATMDRSREFSLVRLVGATVRQVRGYLRWEVALLLVLAAAVGSAAAWATLTGFSIGMVGGSAPAVAPLTVLSILGAATAIAAVATLVPAGVLLRRQAIDEVSER